MSVPQEYLVVHTVIGELRLPLRYRQPIRDAFERFITAQRSGDGPVLAGGFVDIETLSGVKMALRVDTIYALSVVTRESIQSAARFDKDIVMLTQPTIGVQ